MLHSNSDGLSVGEVEEGMGQAVPTASEDGSKPNPPELPTYHNEEDWQ